MNAITIMMPGSPWDYASLTACGLLADAAGVIAKSDSVFDTAGPISVGVLIVCGLIIVVRGGGRQKQLSNVATSLDFKFVPDKDKTRMGHRFDHIRHFSSNKGSTRNHLVGRLGEWGVIACDHSYYHRPGTRSRFRQNGMILLQIPLNMPEVIIEPKSWGDKLVSMLGVKYVEFESRKFSRRFAVRAKDPSFAYDLIHPKAMKWLLRHRGYRWEFDRHTVAMHYNKYFKPREVTKAMHIAAEFVKLIPEHVWARAREDRDTERNHRDRPTQRAVGTTKVEPNTDLTFRRVKRARMLVPLLLVFGLSQLWMAVSDFARNPDVSDVVSTMFQISFGSVLLIIFRSFANRLRAFRKQRRAVGARVKEMFKASGRIDMNELMRLTTCVDEGIARFHIQWAQRRDMLPSNAEIYSSDATAIECTCPKCSAVWEFSSLDCGKRTDCPNCMARFDVADKVTLQISVESVPVA